MAGLGVASSSFRKGPVIVPASVQKSTVDVTAVQEPASDGEDDAADRYYKSASSIKKAATYLTLPDCTTCNNKARQDCPFQKCQSCCDGGGCPVHVKFSVGSLPVQATAQHEGKSLTGVVDGSFSHGHFITVVIDNMAYKGVVFNRLCGVRLYDLEDTAMAVQKTGTQAEATGAGGARPKKKAKTARGHKTAYNFFVSEERPRLAQQNPNKSFGELATLVGQAWKSLSPEERQPYEAMAAKEKNKVS